MEKSSTALAASLRDQLDSLASFEPVDWPVVSLYLDLRPDQHGRDRYADFLRKALPGQIGSLKGDARASLERDAERIQQYVEAEVQPSANGLAIFACSAMDDYFHAVQLEVPVDQHWLFISSVPHLYPLARTLDQYPRYGAVLVDTNSARLFVFSLGAAAKTDRVTGTKTRRSSMGGWSQARYQRHAENFHLQHMKEVVSVLDRMVRDERLDTIVVAADDISRPLLMDQLPKHLAEKIVDVVSLDMKTPDHQVLTETMEVLRQHDANTDVERVEQMIGAWRAGGLAVAGPEETKKALEIQNVEELLIADRPNTNLDEESNEFIRGAYRNGARVRFIEDRELLAQVDGVGALLRFRVDR